ncbi:stage IV sporulation protein FA [Evansella caseinilytica]|uniref:Stage IV sporulation protein FA n=1 Tax=Evansella caseinilytica TaxID=1503961 RepID=A0A1H3PS88_9BACI|nr:M23 family metallopeptidase [Evansella caseinilytica]SDZ03841.1 stage IV sporulation protein FA [Evansella caseinilytica]
MKNRVEQLKRKMDARRRMRRQSPRRQSLRERGAEMLPYSVKHEEEREETLYSFDNRRALPEVKQEPLFRKDRFMIQVLASICLFFILGILFKSSSPAFEGARQFVQKSFQEDFQFGAAAEWYEETFGRPLALLPPQLDFVAPEDYKDDDVYALPATGTVRQSFEQNGRGIFVETTADQQVEAARSGEVRFIGEDEAKEWGKVVVIRHYDGGESWYGMLDNISVKLYDHVQKGEVLGNVSPDAENNEIGVYYFALKEGDTFIDPFDVISFD